MSREITFILEPDNGKLTTEVSAISTKMLTGLRDDLGSSFDVNCGKPGERNIADAVQAIERPPDDSQYIWLYRIYHNSVVDGPGRRSVVQVSGCSIRCPGFIYSLERAKYDLAHERHRQRTTPLGRFILV